MHFSFVIPYISEYHNNLAFRTFILIRPVYYLSYAALTVLTSIEFFFRYKDVFSQQFLVHTKECKRLFHIEYSYKFILFTLKNFYYFSLLLSTRSTWIELYLYMVAIQCTTHRSLCNENILSSIIRNKISFFCYRLTVDNSGNMPHTHIGFILAILHFLYLACMLKAI